MKAQIVLENNQGYHNSSDYAGRLEKAKTYKDLSTICIVPTRGQIPAKVVQSWMGLMSPMNQKFTRIFAIGLEVGEAYSQTIESIINHPELSKWKYILTLEEDNCPPPDGLLKLYENMDKYDVIGGLYWTKGDNGQPMIYGDPNTLPLNFIPQKPISGTIQECNGLGMGFTLFKMDIFKDPKLRRPWFKTHQGYDPQSGGASAYTQDLYFFENIRKNGYKVASDNRVFVGHYDIQNDIMW